MTDTDAIKSVVDTYFECMYESSRDKALAAFHPNAWITGYLNGKLAQMSREEFADLVAKASPSAKDKGEPARLEIVSLDIAGDTAIARVRDDYIGLTFLDTLSFLKQDGNWSIYNKLFHVEGPAN